ncbi:MAG TPA: glycosyltransferase [Candidatus Sericytochromatia bacterium]|jgi:GT2 family glycosyltransferase
MLYPIKVVDIELSRPLTTIENLEGYIELQGLVRLHGTPIGYVKVPVAAGRVSAKTLSKFILEEHRDSIVTRLLQNGLACPPKPEGLRLEDLFDVPPPEYTGSLPLVTVAVCTRDRTDDLALCLDALNQLDYPALDLLVIDNAPTSDATKELVQSQYPKVRYVREPRPGLDWARNRAIIEAQGEIIAYTDDDVVVDSGWVKALAQVFAQNPEVMAVTGLVVPYELEAESQVLFEMYGGFGRGFQRKWYRVGRGNKVPWRLLGTGQFGTGANMAYRRCVFDEIGYFDPAMDVGTVTNGGGDLEMYFRILKEGHTLVYEPSAMVRHRHRRDYAKLRSQIANNGIGLYSYFTCGARRYPDQGFSFLYIAVWWLCWWHIRRLLLSYIHPRRFPRDLILAELQGFFKNFGRYQQAHKTALQIEESFGPQAQTPVQKKPSRQQDTAKRQPAVAVRSIELSQPLQALTDITDYSGVRIFVTWKGRHLGAVEITNTYQPVSKSRLIEAIANQLILKLIEPDRTINRDISWAEATSTLARHYTPTQEEAALPETLPADIPVSVVLATYDRPDDLRNCLRYLVAQKSPRQVEIIVVDNNSSSGLTPPVVAEFPGVVLINEQRKGSSYARNTGISASTGEIVVTIDDDVTAPPDWLEHLVAPFARKDVMVVTGNILPLELETSSQCIFENYGGLGRGFEPLEVKGDWFETSPFRSVPTWQLGATANAAFRASIFSHPQIGLMEEALGAGMPSGVGEDTYLFYKVLKAGYTIVYEPTAYAYHKHRRELSALRRQIYDYSKGHVSYHLITLVQDKDFRALARILVGLPLVQGYRIYSRLRGWTDYPISLVLLEISGNLAGVWALWQSYQRVKSEGRSAPYIPVPERSVAASEPVSVETLQLATVGDSPQA